MQCLNCSRLADRPYGLCVMCFHDDVVLELFKAKWLRLRGPQDDRALLQPTAEEEAAAEVPKIEEEIRTWAESGGM